MPKKISLTKLHLFLENPRLPPCENEMESLYSIVDDQKNKLINLAADIAQYGMNILESIAVFPASDIGSDHYYVAEGNRRISALKLLNNPSLIEDRYPSIAKSFAKIKINPEVDITHVSAEVFPSEDDPNLIKLLQLRHLGEQEGKGVVRWNPEQKARFDAKHSSSNPTVHLLDELEERHILSKEQRENVTKTNWDRVLRPIGQKFLGLIKDKDSGLFLIPEDQLIEFVKKIRLIAEDLRGEKVGYVYNQDQIQKFYEKMTRLYHETAEEPIEDIKDIKDIHKSQSTENSNANSETSTTDKPHESNSSSPAQSASNDGDNPDSIHPTPQSTDKTDSLSPGDLFTNCKTVIPLQYELPSRNARIAKIINELKHLKVEEYPNACGTLLRALIELSAKEYLEYHHYINEATKVEFQESISRVCRILYDTKKIDKTYASAINREKESVRELFNGYMHNTDSYPSSAAIRDIFKTFLKFIKCCLE